MMTRIRQIARRVVPQGARNWINDRRLVRWARLRRRNARLAPTLRRQLAWAGAPAGASPSAARILVPLLETSHYQFFQILALAKALQIRGAEIKVIICDSALDGCELKNSRRRDPDQCLSCRMNARDLVGTFGLDVLRLSDLVTDEQRRERRALAERIAAAYPRRHDYKGVDIIGMTNDSVTRFFYGAVPAEGSPELRHQRARHLYSALIGVDTAERLNDEWAPTSLMNSMAVYSDWAPYAEYFRGRGIPYNLVAMAPFDFKAVMLNYEEIYGGTERFERWRATRSSEFLEPAEEQALDAWLNERFTVGGGFERHYDWFGAGAEGIRVDESKRNLFLFSNLAWDVGIKYEGAMFPDVIAWAVKTVEIVATQPDTHLYVKIHPEEAYGPAHTERGVADAIHERFPTLPPNVTIIPPQLKVRPYELFRYIDTGIVYNGTIGLEMMLKDIPVIAGGAAPYGGHGLSYDPATAADYERAIRGTFTPPKPDPRLVKLFAYFYFIKTQVPWTLTKQVYFDDFDGFTFDRLDALLPGRDAHLDHLCNAILEPETTVIEAWT